MTLLREQQRFKHRLLKRIGHRSGPSAENTIGADLLQRDCNQFLTAHAVHCATLYEIWRKEHGEAIASARWEALQQPPIVKRDVGRFRRRAVTWFPKARNTSGFRKICSFGDDEKMWHKLIADLLTAQHKPRPHIGDWRGRGRDQQISELIGAINSRRQAVVVADIRQAFATVNVDAVYDLPLLSELPVRRVIDYRTHQFVPRMRSVEDTKPSRSLARIIEVAPSGLMEGSPASNAIFSMLMDDLPDQLDERIRAFVYCDNIILLAPSLSQALRAEQALVAYLSSHRAGPFEVISYTQSVCDPFDHLGYCLEWQRGLKVSLARKNWMSFMAKVDDSTEDLGETRRWLQASFPQCSTTYRLVYEQLLEDELYFRSFVRA